MEHDIVRKDLKVRRAGDYSGEIDEMKLRLGVMSGVERMARTCYDDLRYVGVIQVDTKNVHAHVVMVNAGEGSVYARRYAAWPDHPTCSRLFAQRYR